MVSETRSQRRPVPHRRRYQRRVEGLEICICALQLRTGSISLSDPPAVTIDDSQELSSAEARQVAAMLLEAAAEIDGWVSR
jgi:hypothetical protein